MSQEKPNITKVIIRAFTKKSFSASSEINKESPYELPINPESYSRSFKLEYDKSKGQGNQGTDAKYKGTSPEELKLEFMFDGTGTVMGNTQKDVSINTQVYDFLETVYFMNGEIHQPKFLKIVWGKSFTFNCVLTNLDINYTLFNRKGEPLRAKVNASLIGFSDPLKRILEEDKSSPDLTHVRTVMAGDKLPLMTHEIYGDDSWYIEVARANNLTSFRKLKPGQEIFFPSIEREIN